VEAASDIGFHLDETVTAVDSLNTKLTRIDMKLDLSSAQIYNVTTRSYNARRFYNTEMLHVPFRLSVQVPGSGQELARTLKGLATMPPALQDIPKIGEVPRNSRLSQKKSFELSSDRILRLIQFYNESFGIEPDDPLGSRRSKVVHWFTSVNSYYPLNAPDDGGVNGVGDEEEGCGGDDEGGD